MSDKLTAAIVYFEDAVRESDEIIAECSSELQEQLTEQKQHFVVALEAMRKVGDTAPVVHGYWILVNELYGVEFLRCSSCNSNYTGRRTNHCPNCGAKMDRGTT